MRILCARVTNNYRATSGMNGRGQQRMSLGYTRVKQDDDSLSIAGRRTVGQLEILLILNEPGHLHSLGGYNAVDLGDDVRELT